LNWSNGIAQVAWSSVSRRSASAIRER
jgi:hypothetical protein